MKQTDKQHSIMTWRKAIGSLLRWWWVWAAAIVAVAVAYIYKGVTDNPPVSLRVVHNTRIDVTPEQIMAVRDVGQWEFLTINTEEVVEWEHKRTFGTDCWCVSIRAHCGSGWICKRLRTGGLCHCPTPQLNSLCHQCRCSTSVLLTRPGRAPSMNGAR